MSTSLNSPKVYVGTYAKYNEGSISGEWVDLTDFSTEEDFYAHCKEIHSDEEGPELMFQDFENFPKSLYSESSVSQNLIDYAQKWAELDETRLEAFNDFLNNDSSHSEDIEQAFENFESAYNGQFDNETRFAEDYIDSTGMLSEVPDTIQRYFDYEAFGRDLFMGDYWISGNGHVFATNY